MIWITVCLRKVEPGVWSEEGWSGKSELKGEVETAAAGCGFGC